MTSVTSALNAARLISAIDSLALEEGMELTIGTDFETYAELRRYQDGRGPVSAMFDPAVADVNEMNGFWVLGRNAAGDIVHTQAVRSFDMNDEATARRFYGNLDSYFSKVHDADALGARCAFPMMRQRIQGGKVCYHGEIWLSREYRGRGLSALLPHLLMALAFVRWAPVYMFGLVPAKLASCGIACQYGYYHVEPEGFVLEGGGPATANRWLVWMADDDLHRLLQQAPEAESSNGEIVKRRPERVPQANLSTATAAGDRTPTSVLHVVPEWQQEPGHNAAAR